MRKNNKKGFTLAELLIVVAIIAVLVAIAIPIFTSQLEKSRESTDLANARDYYAEISVALLDGSLSNTQTSVKLSGGLTATATYNTTSGVLESVKVAGVPINQKEADWAVSEHKVAGVDVTAPAKGTTTATLTYTFTTETTGAKNTWLSAVAYT